MKKYLTIIAAAAICLLTACSKEKELRAPIEEQNIAEEVLSGYCINATIGEVSTSASVDDATAAFTWNTGDKIAVCISGGKDSMLMAKLFQELERHGKKNFKVVYMVMNPGYNRIN